MRKGIALAILLMGCDPRHSYNTRVEYYDKNEPYKPVVHTNYIMRADGFTTKEMFSEYTLYASQGIPQSCTLTLLEADKIEITDTGCDNTADAVTVNQVPHKNLTPENKAEADRLLLKYILRLQVGNVRKRWEDKSSLDRLKKY